MRTEDILQRLPLHPMKAGIQTHMQVNRQGLHTVKVPPDDPQMPRRRYPPFPLPTLLLHHLATRGMGILWEIALKRLGPCQQTKTRCRCLLASQLPWHLGLRTRPGMMEVESSGLPTSKAPNSSIFALQKEGPVSLR